MKKLLTLFLAVCLLFAFGCGGKEPTVPTVPTNPSEEEGADYNEGVELEKVKPLPYDLLAAQKNEDLEVQVTSRCAVEGVTAIEYTGADYRGAATKVFAYIGFPEDVNVENKVPAVVLVHGGNGTAFAKWVKEWNARGYAAIAMDTEGRRPDGSQDGLGGPVNDMLLTDTLEITEQWMYQAVSAVVRGTSILCSYEEVDISKLGIVGVSWGSVITSIALGIDDRFAFGIPIYGTGHLDESISWFSKYGISKHGFELWDPSHYFPFYTAELHLVNSDHDPYFSANINSHSAYELGAGVTYVAQHTHSQEGAQGIEEVYAFADKYTSNMSFLPEIKRASLVENKIDVWFSIPDDSNPVGIEVYSKRTPLTYTPDTEYSVAIDEDFTIVDTPVRFDPVNGRAEITLPWESELMYFNIVVDSLGKRLRISSRLFVLDENAIPEPEKTRLAVAPVQEWKNADVWNNEMRQAYLQPYWYSREIYNETVVFIGEESEATLMYTPSEVRFVRDYSLTKTYQEGKDYIIQGNKIRRVKGSSLPYWEPEEYFPAKPNDPNIVVRADSAKLDVALNGQRYLYYGEFSTFTDKQIAVTYRHNEAYTGNVPEGQTEKLTNLLTKLHAGDSIKLMIYGDSVATGCNASGTEFGGMIAPYMPNAYSIVKSYLEDIYGAKITMDNKAVGGWQLSQCLNEYDARIKGQNIDIMILRIGGNDNATNEYTYKDYLEKLIDKFFSDYPRANLIIQTPELPNQQAGIQTGNITWTGNISQIDDWTRSVVREHRMGNQIAIADVQSFTNWVESRKKLTRDWLANNVNHANDFMIRAYAQIILKTICGENFVDEQYE